MNWYKLIISSICLLLFSVLVYLVISRSTPTNTVPDTLDSLAIQDVIHHSYTVYRGSLQNGGDVREFDKVFVNTNDYQYENNEVREFVELVLGPEEAASGGYLNAIKAKYIAFGCGIKLLKEVEQIAKKEGRRISADEIRKVSEQCYGVIPPSVVENGAPGKLEFKSIVIDEDYAKARYDDGAALLEAILRKINGRWLISNIRPLEVHF